MLTLKVRRAVQIEGLSKRAAARRFGIDSRTVTKMMTHSVPQGYVRTKLPVRPKLDPFIAIIDGVAVGDLGRIGAWIATEDPRAAGDTLNANLGAIDRLETFPHMGPRGRAANTYERLVAGTPDIIVYELQNKPTSLIVVAIFHGSQNR